MDIPIIITDSNNKTKIKSIEDAFAHFKVTVKVTSISIDSPDVRPLSRNETLSGIENRVKRLIKHYYDKNALFISIQKGTTILDADEIPPKLTVACAIYKPSIMGLVDTVFSDRELELPIEIRTLVESGMEVYEAYEEYYKQKPKGGSWSLYDQINIVTHETELMWMTNTVTKTIRKLIENGTAFKIF